MLEQSLRNRGACCMPPRHDRPPLAIARRCVGSAGILAAAAALVVGTLRAEPLRVESATAEEKKKQEKKYPEVDEARAKLDKMDVDGALESLKKAAKAYPELPAARVQMARILFASGRIPAGRAQLEKAVTETPDDAEPYLYFGELAMREAQWTDAALLYEKGLALVQASKLPADRKKELLESAYGGLSATADAREQWESLRKIAQAWLKSDPEASVAHQRLGKALFMLKKPKEAYAELQAASRLDEKTVSAEVSMAILYEKEGDNAAAERALKQAVTLAPKDIKTRIEVTQLLWQTGRLDEAKLQAAEALKLDPNSGDALVLSGLVARYLKDYPAAVKFFERAYLESPGNTLVASQLALALAESGEDATRQRALTLAEANVRQAGTNPNPDVLSTLGWVYFKLGRHEESERALRAAIGAPNVAPDTAYFYARLADARNRGDQAKAVLEQALKTKTPMAYRQEAQKLYDTLAKKPDPEGLSKP